MTPEKWEKIGEIYHAALEIESDGREAFLEEACGRDVVLRLEVESLISAAEQAGDFIVAPALPALLEDAAKLRTEEHTPDPVDLADPAGPGQISRYRIKSLLGSGGMGKVYLAQDTRLGREVALKLLPQGATDIQTAKRRMLREARSVAALNHPNIVTIYSIEEAEDSVFIVMEYVKGETLTSRIKQGKLKFKQVLDLGVQIAGALDAAHSAGLIHRDIKPSNIIITPEEQVKLLDFGIVKITKPLLSEGLGADSRLTRDGDIIGTVAYMSPEQARGEALDSRTDIYSLGSMLYEAATGRLPFNGANLFLMAHEIMTTEPPPPSAINHHLPLEFDQIIRRALAKDQKRRYQSASELIDALAKLNVKTGSDSSPREETKPRPDEDLPTVKRHAIGNINAWANAADRPLLNQKLESGVARGSSVIILDRKTVITFAIGFIMTVVALAFGAYNLFDWTRLSNQPAGMPGAAETKLTNTGNIGVARPAISPNGKYIAYTVQDSQRTSSLWIRQLDAFSSVRVINPSNADFMGVTFSRDGNHLYYGMREENAQVASLYRIPLLGGVPKKIIADVDSPVSFSPDGSRFVFRRVIRERSERAHFVANTDGSGETKIATAKPPEFFGDPVWSPDGKMIVCSSGHADGGSNRYVVEISVGDWKMRPISARRWYWVGPVEWLADSGGLLMIASESPAEPYRVWRLSYPSGEARRVTNNAVSYTRLSLSADSSTLLVSQQKRNSHLWIIPRDDPRLARKMTFGAGGFRSYLNWTPDGKIVFDSDSAGVPDISIMEEDGSNQKQLLADSTGKSTAVSSDVSPDGRYVAFGYDQTGVRHIWRMDINGGNPVRLTNGRGEDHPHCSPDGKWVIYTDIGSDQPTLWKVPIDGGEPAQLTKSRTRFPVVSPDGKLIACFYSNAESNIGWRLALIPFDGGEVVRIFPQVIYAGYPAKWTPDGHSLTYIDSSQSNIWVQPVEGGEPKKLTDFSTDLIFGFDWAPDGKRLACVRGIWERDLILIRNFR